MLTIDVDTENRLLQVAKQTGQDVQSIVYEALKNYLEDMQDGLIAQQALQEINAGAIPLTLAQLDVYLDSHG